jgi:hypothetical protein
LVSLVIADNLLNISRATAEPGPQFSARSQGDSSCRIMARGQILAPRVQKRFCAESNYFGHVLHGIRLIG